MKLAGFVFACALPAQPKPGGGAIEGNVFNLVTGEPLRKAAVNLTSPEIRLLDYTDSAGKFQFSGLPAGTYRLSATRAGFLPHSARRPVSLASDEAVGNSEIRLAPA